jgi:predicted RNA binding protein YcfA (HicA-like mRNA interferase family)
MRVRLPRLTASEAQAKPLAAGFVLLRSKGSHRIYFRAGRRIVVPFHAVKRLHPKIVREVIEALGDSSS